MTRLAQRDWWEAVGVQRGTGSADEEREGNWHHQCVYMGQVCLLTQLPYHHPGGSLDREVGVRACYGKPVGLVVEKLSPCDGE